MSDLTPARMRPCRRCGHPTRVDRMVQGYGRNCAAALGLIGGTVDTGHRGPDLFDLMELEPEDECDGGDRPADSDLSPGRARRRPG
ncbi:hypothetical protein ACTOB_002378 [Actinoplanes oblitus]|uniref:Uncharacterized protein n=1 Tax=Actinoplanes oblitus TaxID=3040509 RepID=A0ABY8WMA7_9ACTN|nr:hypothetical protein [Actinoplanes oblitus]WIM98768.1 hypothetical protein ACTOB_002378 [Actinoplanes oblitus]